MGLQSLMDRLGTWEHETVEVTMAILELFQGSYTSPASIGSKCLTLEHKGFLKKKPMNCEALT